MRLKIKGQQQDYNRVFNGSPSSYTAVTFLISSKFYTLEKDQSDEFPILNVKFRISPTDFRYPGQKEFKIPEILSMDSWIDHV